MLNIDTETICDILDKARQFQAKEEVTFPEETAEMDSYHVLADYKDDPVFKETIDIINNLRTDQQATLVALMYMGREDYDKEDWYDLFEFAKSEMTDHTGQYLLTRPLVADDIEKGLDILGITYRD